MNGIQNILLIIISVFTMNLSLQCAIGIRGIAESKSYSTFNTLVKLVIIWISTMLLWVLFSKIIASIISSIVIYVLFFPVSFIVYEGLEYILFQLILKKDRQQECFISFPQGIIAVAGFICLNIAKDFSECLILSFGFTLGILLVCLIIREIRRRAALEAVPQFLRGKPLAVISLGLLSLIFSAASILLLRMISF